MGILNMGGSTVDAGIVKRVPELSGGAGTVHELEESEQSAEDGDHAEFVYNVII